MAAFLPEIQLARSKQPNKNTARAKAAGGSKTIAGQVYERLREDIVGGKLPPNSKLKLEVLLEKYQVGMSPLREALSRLVGDMLVTTHGQRGFWVAPLSLSDLDDVSRVRASLETQALALSIQNSDAEWEARLKQAYDSLADVESELPDESARLPAALSRKWEAANREFHSALVANCGSEWLMRLRAILYQQSERYRRISLEQARGYRDIHDEHRSIFLAASRKNTLKACELIEFHMQETAQAVRRALIERGAFSGLEMENA